MVLNGATLQGCTSVLGTAQSMLALLEFSHREGPVDHGRMIPRLAPHYLAVRQRNIIAYKRQVILLVCKYALSKIDSCLGSSPKKNACSRSKQTRFFFPLGPEYHLYLSTNLSRASARSMPTRRALLLVASLVRLSSEEVAVVLSSQLSNLGVIQIEPSTTHHGPV
ncbi:hypothetical protein BDN67DRAFT_336839 [Paxillus ammoniavirescens]|nr:hypothetical protein BDN67DRAFT_336839 [Paxillus ammoniavirescens]